MEKQNAAIEGAFQGAHVRFEDLSTHTRNMYLHLQQLQQDIVAPDDVKINDIEIIERDRVSLRQKTQVGIAAQGRQNEYAGARQKVHNQELVQAIQSQVATQGEVVVFVGSSSDAIEFRLQKVLSAKINAAIAARIAKA